MNALPDPRALVEALDEPSLLVEGTRVLVANAPAIDLLGSIEGRDIRLAIRHPAALEPILDGRAGEAEVRGIGGSDRPWAIAARPAGPGLLLVRLVDRSTTRAAEQMRVDFVANASHELRTPLATILGYAETLAEEDSFDQALYARFGGVIRAEAQRMLRIVEDLMSLSRIEADRFVAPMDLVDPATLIRLAADGASGLADHRRCSVEAVVDPDLRPIRGDQPQLLQLLDNLLANALRYGCPASGSKVELSARAQGNSILLTVVDHGEGIPREHLPRLTERFYRVNEARSRDSGGTGLGLAIVKHIVERHRGTLDIRSNPGEGTRVTVSLPAG